MADDLQKDSVTSEGGVHVVTADKAACSRHHGALLEIMHNRCWHRDSSEKLEDGESRRRHCDSVIVGYFRPNKLVAMPIYHQGPWEPWGSGVALAAAYMGHLQVYSHAEVGLAKVRAHGIEDPWWARRGRRLPGDLDSL